MYARPAEPDLGEAPTLYADDCPCGGANKTPRRGAPGNKLPRVSRARPPWGGTRGPRVTGATPRATGSKGRKRRQQPEPVARGVTHGRTPDLSWGDPRRLPQTARATAKPRRGRPAARGTPASCEQGRIPNGPERSAPVVGAEHGQPPGVARRRLTRAGGPGPWAASIVEHRGPGAPTFDRSRH